MTVTADDGILSPLTRQVGRRGAEIHVSESRADMLEATDVAVRVDTAKLGSAQRDLLVYLLAATIAVETDPTPSDRPSAWDDFHDSAASLELLRDRTEALRLPIRPDVEAQFDRLRRTIDANPELIEGLSESFDDSVPSAVRDAVAAMPTGRMTAAVSAAAGLGHLPQDRGTTFVRLTRVPWSSAAASEALGVDRSPSAVSQALRHLERRGLVFRDASGGRTTAVQLTNAGRRVAGELQEKP